MVNVWPARVPVNTVPVTGPLLTTVTVRSGATVYVNDAWVSLDPAPPRVTGVSGWVRLTERLCDVPVPSPWKVRIPCVLDEKLNLPSIGVRFGLNPGGSATRHVPSPVATESPCTRALSCCGSASAAPVHSSITPTMLHRATRRMGVLLHTD